MTIAFNNLYSDKQYTNNHKERQSDKCQNKNKNKNYHPIRDVLFVVAE